jgi:hypothetical protein
MATKPEKSKKTDNAESNRMKRLLRTQKKQPNNKQIEAALKTTRMHRKTPVNPVWSASWRRIAVLFKEMTGRFDPAIMSSNIDVSRAAMAKPGTNTWYKPLPMPKQPFSIGAQLGIQ